MRFLCGLRRCVLLTALLLAASSLAAADAALAAWTKVAVWEMNEGPAASTMHDSSGNNRDGEIGNLVITAADGAGGGDNRAYRWPAGDLTVEDRERLVTVDRSALNPRGDAFSVTVRFRTHSVDHNIIQKGQARSAGGMWKIDMNNNGRVFCLFRGEAGQGAIGSAQGVSLANDRWHTVRCVRRSGSVTITVDGGTPRKQPRTTGRIANDLPLTIGGKWNCNPANNVSCQYYVGRVDRVVVRRR